MEPPRESDTPETIELNIRGAVVNDQAADKDALGFEPYVEAVAAFLLDKDTHPPLTLSIEGDWGSGKSSFMLQLAKALREHPKRVITFNAWQHDKDEAMWASFAISATEQFLAQLPLRERFRRYLRVRLSPTQKIATHWTSKFWAKWNSGIEFKLYASLAALVTLVVMILLWLYLVHPLFDLVPPLITRWTAIVAVVTPVILLLKRVSTHMGSPLYADVKKYLATPDYASKVSFLEHFHRNFGEVLSTYGDGPDEPVFVFIDDLDRCDTPRAADLLQALHLMVADSKQLVVILGMDREKVAASIAVKHEKLIQTLYPNTAGFGALEYGYSFIEKFVQLPFRVPQPKADDVEVLLKSLSGSPEPVASENKNQALRDDRALLGDSYEASDVSESEAADIAEQIGTQVRVAETIEAVRVFVAPDSELVRAMAKMAARFLDFNPRRIKQFLSLYRLQVFLAARRGLFGRTGKEPGAELTPQKLGKFVILAMICPRVLADLEDEPLLLSWLQTMIDTGECLDELIKLHSGEMTLSQGVATGKFGSTIQDSERAIRWFVRQEIHGLLTYVPAEYQQQSMKYSLRGLDVTELVQVSPARVPITGPPVPNAPLAGTSPAGNLPLSDTALTESPIAGDGNNSIDSIADTREQHLTNEILQGAANAFASPPEAETIDANAPPPQHANAPAPNQAQAASNANAIPTMPPARVLWVDDHPENNAHLVQRLNEAGIEVDLATSLSEALSKFGSNAYGAVVTDMGRTESGTYQENAGVDLVRTVRSMHDSLPLYVYCAKELVEKYKGDAAAAGAYAVFSSGRSLTNAIEKALLDYPARDIRKATKQSVA